MEILTFVNDKFRILAFMYNHQLSYLDKQIVKLSQNEIAEGLKFNRIKVNGIMSELMQEEYIEKVRNGEYVITDKGKRIVEKFMEGENNE